MAVNAIYINKAAKVASTIRHKWFQLEIPSPP
jgi:hypothetical protein